MASEEFNKLEELVRESDPVTTTDVKRVVERYFKGIQWSLLKDEWENHMSEQQREALYTKLLVNSIDSTTSKPRQLKLDDLGSDIDPSLRN